MNQLNYPIKKITYTGEQKKGITMPLGGIGTGCIGLTAYGVLTNFETFNKSLNENAFFAVKAKKEGEICDVRVLQTKKNATNNATFPCFDESDFVTSYPFGEIDFCSSVFPGKVHLTAWNPFIPLNDIDSSIPAILVEYEVENNDVCPVEYTFYGVLNNSYDFSINKFHDSRNENIKYVKHTLSHNDSDEVLPGEMCIGVYGENIKYQKCLYIDSKNETLRVLIDDIRSGELDNRMCEPYEGALDSSVISTEFVLLPGECKKVRFAISWYTPVPFCDSQADADKNYYSRYFKDSDECVYYCLSQWERLFEETDMYRQLLFTSTLPVDVIKTVVSSIVSLRSSDYIRVYDGSLRKVNNTENDIHSVLDGFYNSFVLPYLFPNLERLIIADNHKKVTKEIINSDVTTRIYRKLVNVLRIYGEFKLCGNYQWLLSMWDDIVISIKSINNINDHIILKSDESNEEQFDLNLLYSLSLKALCEMANIVKDKKNATIFNDLYEKWKVNFGENDCLSVISSPDALLKIYTDITSLCDSSDSIDDMSVELCKYQVLSDNKSFVNYSLLGKVCGQKIDAYNKSYKFVPDMRFAEKSVFRCFLCFDNFLGFVERGIDYIQLKCIKGSIKIREIETPDTPLMVKCGGFEIGFEKVGNKAVLDNDSEVNTSRDLLVIFKIN